MMSNLRVATLAGIPVRLHWSFLALIATWAGWALYKGGPGELFATSGLLGALFGSVVLHELGHALAARFYGIETAHITLYPFGGVAAIEDMPTEPREELVIALAGPAVNFALAALALGGWGLIGGWALLAFTAVNLVMGVFNLVPAFPMDGGRVLRAILASRMGFIPASELSMRIGSVFAWIFLAVGLVMWTPGLLFIGLFLHFSIRSERARLVRRVWEGWRAPDTRRRGGGGGYRVRWRVDPQT